MIHNDWEPEDFDKKNPTFIERLKTRGCIYESKSAATIQIKILARWAILTTEFLVIQTIVFFAMEVLPGNSVAFELGMSGPACCLLT